MPWFNDIAPNDAVLAAVACVSPLGVWLPFWFDHRQKLRDRYQRQLGELQRLRDHVRDYIQPWANEWPEASYDHQWYLPSWQVRPFEWQYVENFNRVVMAGDYPRELTAGLVRLEGAARRFHESLARHEEFRKRVPEAVKQNLQPVYAEARKRTSALSDEEVARLSPGLGDEGRRWVQNLYQSFRRLHVETIGRQGGDGLYEAWRSVITQMDRVQAGLQAARDPWWYRWGHGLAGVLALTGALFLVDFWWSFVDDRIRREVVVDQRGATTATAAPDSAIAPADTAAVPESTSAKPGHAH